MKKEVLFIVLLLSIQLLIAQEKNLYGLLVHPTLFTSNIHISNTTKNIHTISNKTGAFNINGALNDTLLISSVQFEKQLVIIDSLKYHQTSPILISLTEEIATLDEVVINNLSGNIVADMQRIQKKTIVSAKDVGIPVGKKPTPERIPKFKDYAFMTLSASIDIEMVYKSLSGYYKDLKTIRKWQYNDQYVEAIINYFGHSFFEQNYNIPKDHTYGFVAYCADNYEEFVPNYKQRNYELLLQQFDLAVQEFENFTISKKE